MQQLGIEISANLPHKLDTADMDWADLVVTMGCGDECPYIPSKRYIDWDLTDPAGQSIEMVRIVRDEIARSVRDLVAALASVPA
jgi:arsenate reductase